MFGDSQFGQTRFGQGQGTVVITESIPFIGDAGGWPGPVGRRKRIIQPIKEDEHTVTHFQISVSFEGSSTFYGMLSGRAVAKAKFKRFNAIVGRMKGRGMAKAVSKSTSPVSIVKMVGRMPARTRGPVSIQASLSGDSGIELRAIGIENPPEDIMSILN